MAQSSQVLEGFGTCMENSAVVIAPDKDPNESRQFINTSVFYMVSGIIPVGLGVSMSASITTAGVTLQQQPVTVMIL